MSRSQFGSVVYIAQDYYHVFWSDGTRRRSKRIHGTRDDAEDFLARMRSGSGSQSDCTYSEYWRRSVVPTFGTLQPKTVSGYKQVWNHDLSPAISSLYVGATDWRLVERVLGEIESPSVQRAAYRLWSKICNLAVRDGILDRNPIDRSIKLKPLRKRKKDLYTPSEIANLMDEYTGKYAHLVILELGGGLRHEEACAVTASDVSWDGVYASVSVSKAHLVVDGYRYTKSTKTSLSERRVLLGEPFSSALRRCWLPSDESELVNPTTATHNWRAWCKSHGWKYVPFGTMRSNFATLACECCDSSLVSLALGHSGGTTRGRNYQQSTRRGMQIVADAMSDCILGAVR